MYSRIKELCITITIQNKNCVANSIPFIIFLNPYIQIMLLTSHLTF